MTKNCVASNASRRARSALGFLLAGVLALMAACASEPLPQTAAGAEAPAPRPAQAAPSRAQTQPVLADPAAPAAPRKDSRDYVVGPGDVLRITVYQNADLTLDTRVSEGGAISYPLLGQVQVGGLTISAAEKAIADGLRNGNFIRQPQVNVLLMQVRGNQASVLGLVNRPGRYPIEVNGMRLSELLAQAGGVAQGGSDVVVLSGTRDGKPFRTQVDVAAVFAAGSSRMDDPIVLNGDTLYVDRAATVYIYGEVQRPGPIRLDAGMTVMQALAAGGGLTQRGTQRGLKVNRRDAQGNLKELSPKMNDTLQSGDVIYVRESLF